MKFLVLFCIGFLLIGLIVAESPQCLQPVDSGICYAAKPRYAYSRDGGCQKFTYGGCGGNDNNFESYEECVQACMVPR